MPTKKNRGGTWNKSTLRERGWTNSLISQLLPPPPIIHRGPHTLALWKADQVRAAEADRRFQAQRVETPQPVHISDQAAAADAALGIQALTGTWEACPKEEGDLAWQLAAHYHRALSGRFPTAWRLNLRPPQAKGALHQFLSLAEEPDPNRIPVELNRFSKLALWIGRRLHASNPLIQQVVEGYPHVLYSAAKTALGELCPAQGEEHVAALLALEDFPAQQLLSQSLATVYAVYYVPQAIRSSLSFLVALHPKDEYPEARAIQRHFVLHIGGTNTGKTYAGFQRLKAARTGVYLAPLRLLALEAQETLLDAGVDCSLTTGEEEDRREGDTHVAATAEKLDTHTAYQVAVIDECQMIADRQRGYAWTRAILGVQAPEVHLCAAPQAKELLLRLIESCGDSYEVQYHERSTPLLCMRHVMDYTRVQPGDALITFSKVGVLQVAEDLRQRGKEPAIIYGALPYATRRRQMEGFLEGRMQYVVSTDAIGMGLNLPIRRVIFMDTEKYDGIERRALKPEEIQQIAGRAGRFGMYDKGFVGATENLSLIQTGLEAVVPPLQEAVVGFSDLVLQVEFDLLEVLTQWNQMPTVAPFVKLDITRYLTLISKIREAGFVLSKEQELKAANIPFDETEEPLRALFFDFLRQHQAGEALQQPPLPLEENRTLPELELYCRKLDLYFSFAKAFGHVVDEEALYERREDVAEEINEILLHKLRNNIRFCAQCGAALPLHQRGRVCDSCYRRRSDRGGRHTRKRAKR